MSSSSMMTMAHLKRPSRIRQMNSLRAMSLIMARPSIFHFFEVDLLDLGVADLIGVNLPHQFAPPPDAEAGSGLLGPEQVRSDEHTSDLTSLMRILYASLCLTHKTYHLTHHSL